MVEGSCLCGTVCWRVDGDFTRMSHCHCSMCRKAHGTAFATFAAARPDSFSYIQGEDNLVTYRLPEARFFSQVFCKTCGSGMPRADAERGIAIIPLGCLDDDPGSGAVGHIFVGSKAEWYTIADDLPRFEEGPG